MTLDPDMSVAELISVVERVAKLGAQDTFIELSINGVVFRIYPGRVNATDEKDRLKNFVVFVRALMRMVKLGESEFILRQQDDEMEIGIRQNNSSYYVDSDLMTWMPCEIDRVDLPVTPPSFSVPTFDDDDVAVTTGAPRTLRKIIL